MLDFYSQAFFQVSVVWWCLHRKPLQKLWPSHRNIAVPILKPFATTVHPLKAGKIVFELFVSTTSHRGTILARWPKLKLNWKRVFCLHRSTNQLKHDWLQHSKECRPSGSLQNFFRCIKYTSSLDTRLGSSQIRMKFQHTRTHSLIQKENHDWNSPSPQVVCPSRHGWIANARSSALKYGWHKAGSTSAKANSISNQQDCGLMPTLTVAKQTDCFNEDIPRNTFLRCWHQLLHTSHRTMPRGSEVEGCAGAVKISCGEACLIPPSSFTHTKAAAAASKESPAGSCSDMATGYWYYWPQGKKDKGAARKVN